MHRWGGGYRGPATPPAESQSPAELGPTLCDQPPPHQPMYPSTPHIFPWLGAVCKQMLEAQTWDGPLTGSEVAQMSPARALHGCCAVTKCLSLPVCVHEGTRSAGGLHWHLRTLTKATSFPTVTGPPTMRRKQTPGQQMQELRLGDWRPTTTGTRSVSWS